MARKAKPSVVSKARQMLKQFFAWLEIRINRIRTGSLSGEVDLVEIDLLHRLQPGQIAYCEMPFSDWELAAIPKGHRCRPYLIIDKEDDALIGVPSSHKPHPFPKWRQLHLSRSDYPQFLFFGDQRYACNDTWIDLGKPVRLPADKLLSRSIVLDRHDRAFADRIFRVLRGRKTIRKLYTISDQPVSVCVGDVLAMGKDLLLVSSFSQNEIYGFIGKRIRQPQSDSSHVRLVNGGSFELTDRKRKAVLRKDTGRLVSFCSTKGLLELEAQNEAVLLEEKRKKEGKAKRKATFAGQAARFYATPGELFRLPFGDEEFAYLFSSGPKDYFVDMESFYENDVRPFKVTLKELEPACALLSPDELEEIARKLAKRAFIDEPLKDAILNLHRSEWDFAGDASGSTEADDRDVNPDILPEPVQKETFLQESLPESDEQMPAKQEESVQPVSNADHADHVQPETGTAAVAEAEEDGDPSSLWNEEWDDAGEDLQSSDYDPPAENEGTAAVLHEDAELMSKEEPSID